MSTATLPEQRTPNQRPTRTKRSILVIEDETDLVDLLCYNLEREGYSCRRAMDGAAGLAEAKRQRPDLILLDRMLPSLSGEDVATQLRRDPQTAGIPIIMLTAKAEEADELVGFALGVDDYIAKPFSMKSLVARVSAVLRRAAQPEGPRKVLARGPFQIDVSRHEVLVDGVSIGFTATEFRILQALLAADGRVLTRSQLIDAALGTEVAVTDRTIDVHITALRRKIVVACPDTAAVGWIQTIRGVGYTFRDPPAHPG